MKYILLIVSIMLPLSAFSATVTEQPHIVSIDEVSFNFDSGSIAKYTGNAKNIIIPNSFNGVLIKSIQEEAFAKHALTHVTLPSSLLYIGKFAFFENQLTEIILPSSLLDIGAYAFNSNQLARLSIPNSVVSVGSYAFKSNQLTHITIPDSIVAIHHNTFDSNKLKTVTLPDTILSIGHEAFSSNKLTKVLIFDSIRLLEKSAFDKNVKIKKIVTPAFRKGGYENYVKIPNVSDDICSPLVKAYINDRVILSGQASFQQFINVFPSNHVDFLQMYDVVKIKRKDGDNGFCTGRYKVAPKEFQKIMDHWASFYTEANAEQWFQINLYNLAGKYRGGTYPLLAKAMQSKLTTPSGLAHQLAALKTLPRSTQKTLVNTYKAPLPNKQTPRAIFQIKGVDTSEQCDNERCAYLKTLIDDRFKTIGDN